MNVVVIMMMLLSMSMVVSAEEIPASVPADVIKKGWEPVVTMLGGVNEVVGANDERRAIAHLRDLVNLHQTMFSRTQYHSETEAFVQGLWQSLERFQLKKFYRLLPEEKGEWRALTVFGYRDNDRYIIEPSHKTDAATRQYALGSTLTQIKAKKVNTSQYTSYVFNHHIHMGVGALQWGRVQKASKEALVNLTEGDKRLATSDDVPWITHYNQRVAMMNPQLSLKDKEIVASIWAAFPHSGDLLFRLGRLNSVILDHASSNVPYQQLQLSFSLLPERIRLHYPKLAKHIKKLRSLLTVELNVSNQQGHVATMRLDTRTLTASINAVVLDGRIVPAKGENVVSMPSVKEGSDKQKYRVSVNATMDILGIITHMRNINTQVLYQPTKQGMQLNTAMTTVPDIHVEGAAFGFMPTALVDVFLPTNIDELMREFMQVAVSGNGGQGITTNTIYSQPDKHALATLDIKIGLEALDNFLVRIGMGIVSKRIIPSEDVFKEINQMGHDMVNAFSRDLDVFEVALGRQQLGD